MEVIFENLSLTLGEKRIFDRFNLHIGRNEKVMIRGKSGLGKSTLLRLIMGFVQPNGGKIFLNGELQTSENIWDLRSKMAYIPQEFNFNNETVEAHISSIMAYKTNRHLGYDHKRTSELIAQFDLSGNFLHRNISELSTGEKQRLSIITAMLLERELILADEPTSALDGELKTEVLNYLAGIKNKTVIVVSHEIMSESKHYRILNLE